jgi:elongation factor G
MHVINGKEMKMSIRDREEINLPWGGKLIFLNCIVGGSIDARFLPAIMKGSDGENGDWSAHRFICPRH